MNILLVIVDQLRTPWVYMPPKLQRSAMPTVTRLGERGRALLELLHLVKRLHPVADDAGDRPLHPPDGDLRHDASDRPQSRVPDVGHDAAPERLRHLLVRQVAPLRRAERQLRHRPLRGVRLHRQLAGFGHVPIAQRRARAGSGHGPRDPSAVPRLDRRARRRRQAVGDDGELRQPARHRLVSALHAEGGGTVEPAVGLPAAARELRERTGAPGPPQARAPASCPADRERVVRPDARRPRAPAAVDEDARHLSADAKPGRRPGRAGARRARRVAVRR